MRAFTSTSNATIIELEHIVIKFGDGAVGTRIDEQTQWMIAHESDGVMPVLFSAKNVCVMPRAQAFTHVNPRAMFTDAVRTLKTYVWSKPAQDPYEDVEAKVMNKFLRVSERVTPQLARATLKRVCNVNWDTLPRGLTHGDPTFANMLELHGRVVFTDPLPSGELPDVLALDYGKLVQSLAGFEKIKHGWTYSVCEPVVSWVDDLCVDENEYEATIVFALLHIMRLLPYVGDEYADEFIDVFDALLCL